MGGVQRWWEGRADVVAVKHLERASSALIYLKIPSRSRPGEHYLLTCNEHGYVLTCDCKGFFYRQHCRHVEEYQNALAFQLTEQT